MTVLMGLPARLAAVRQMVLLETKREGDWRYGVPGLARACGAIVAVPPDGGWTDSGAALLRRVWPTTDAGSRLLGIDASDELGRRLAEDVQPDLVIEATPTPGWPHQWALHGAWAPGGAGFDFCLFDGAASGWSGLPGQPLLVYAVVGDLGGAQSAVTAGATRLAWRLAPLPRWRRNAGRAVQHVNDEMAQAADLLAQAWRRANPDAAAAVAKGWRDPGAA